jgi:hypothetical protein
MLNQASINNKYDKVNISKSTISKYNGSEKNEFDDGVQKVR